MRLNILIGLLLGAFLLVSVNHAKAELPDKFAITFYDQVRHFKKKDYYNEHNINYMGVTINNWTFSTYSNSFFEPTKMIQYEWDTRFNSWSGGFISVAWVSGYSDAQNFVAPLAGLRFGPRVGPQAELTLIPGAVAWGFKFVFSDNNNK